MEKNDRAKNLVYAPHCANGSRSKTQEHELLATNHIGDISVGVRRNAACYDTYNMIIKMGTQ